MDLAVSDRNEIMGMSCLFGAKAHFLFGAKLNFILTRTFCLEMHYMFASDCAPSIG